MNYLLLLDDDPDVLKMLPEHLSAPGICVIACSEMEAAQCLLERFHPFMLVTDLEVSPLGGLEGMRLIRHAVAHFPEIEVIIYSSHTDDRVEELGRQLGANEVLAKGRDFQLLGEIVHQHAKTLENIESASLQESEIFHVEALDDILSSHAVTSVLQPIVELSGSESNSGDYGLEFLARGPKNSLLRSPEILFSYASHKEKLFELDMLCIEAALEESKTIKSDSLYFINVQPRSMSHPEFRDRLCAMVRSAAYNESRIVLELTEQQTILNPKAFRSTLDELRDKGFRIALDDYGEGYSNLHLLQELRPEYLKISGPFCQNIHKNERQQIIVRSTVEMARKLKILTVIEHIETKEDLDAVCKLGVAYGQGYYFGQPGPAKDLTFSN